MKRLKTIMIALALTLAGGFAWAQLVNVDRTQNHQWLVDDTQVQLGNLPDAVLEYDTVQTPDALVLRTPATQDCLLVSKKADVADLAIADLGSAGVCLVSDGGDKSFKLYHNDTNAVLDTTSGSITLVDNVSTTGTFTSSIATSIGWSVVTGANTACNTTCTNGCVFGQDTDGATKPILDCADATSDRCVCAGAN